MECMEHSMTLADHRESILSIVSSMLIKFESKLREVGLQSKVSVAEEGIGLEISESEVTIDFTDANGIFDVVEFHICRSSRAVVTTNELRTWLDSTLRDVVARRQLFLEGEPPPAT